MVQARFCKIFKIILLLSGLFFFGNVIFLPTAMARLIDPEALVLQVIHNNKKVGQFIVFTKVKVFDPEALSPLSEKSIGQALPHSLPKKSYKQKIIFVRDDFVGIETFSSRSKLIHLTYKKGLQELHKNYSRSRYFSPEDVFFEPMLFFTKFEGKFLERIGSYGLSANQVKMVFYRGQLLYQLGNEEEHLLIHPTHFRVEKIQQLVKINGRSYPLEIQFSKFDKKLKRVPQLIQYRIHGRLFKELKVSSLTFRRVGTEKRKFLKKHKKAYSKATTIEVIELATPEWKDPEAVAGKEKAKISPTQTTVTP